MRPFSGFLGHKTLPDDQQRRVGEGRGSRVRDGVGLHWERGYMLRPHNGVLLVVVLTHIKTVDMDGVFSKNHSKLAA